MAAKFGTSGLRGLSSELVGDTTLVHTLAFGRYLLDTGRIAAGDTVYIGRDFRESSPAVLELCARALLALDLQAVDCGAIPTPALAFYAMSRNSACLMVTGSHIPADRNGIKFYRPDGEISKTDEAEITRYAAQISDSELAGLKSAKPADVTELAKQLFESRLATILHAGALAGLRVGVYQHSTVARDMLVMILEHFGADVVALGRSETFIPVDTEAVSEETEKLLQAWAAEYGLDAIVSADGDGDRPLVADESGRPLRGDLLGVVSALYLKADAAVTPVTSNSSIENNAAFETIRTRVGSPFVISGMEAAAEGGKSAIVGFEANGGVLLQSDFTCAGATLDALPTRDCFVPILAVLQKRAESNQPLSAVAASYGLKTALADRLENYASERSGRLMKFLQQSGENLSGFLKPLGAVRSVNEIDGLRVTLDGGRVVHLRPSGNAPEMRCYVEAETPEAADALLRAGLELLSNWDAGQP